MEKITFDAGVKSYRINGGALLKFNPADPNLYARFLEAVEKIKELESAMEQSDGQQALETMCQADRQIKQLLGWVFGNGNDFDALLGGVFALVSGIMVYIAVEELLPSSRQYGHNRLAVLCTFGGIAAMLLTHAI